jgi:hypothetical protein
MPFKNRKRFIFFPLIALAFITVAGFTVMFLWNAIIPSLFVSAGTLTFWQAIGLFILCKILFGGFRGRGPGFSGGPSWRKKMMNMSEEEREKFKAEWRERCGRE